MTIREGDDKVDDMKLMKGMVDLHEREWTIIEGLSKKIIELDDRVSKLEKKNK